MLQKALLETKLIGRLIVAFLFYLFPVLLFAKLATEIPEPSTLQADANVLEWLHQFANPALDRLALWVTNCGGPVGIVAFTTVAVVTLWLLHRRRAAIILMLGVGGAAVINAALKLMFHRARPDLWVQLVHEDSFSFPSGHAMISAALAFSVMYILWYTHWRWWAVSLGLLYTFVIGLSRLYLGVHYPTDVLAGWAVGFTWIVVIRMVLRQSRQWLHHDQTAT
jgi:membrane-associated phospholipid phosphatase